MMRLSSGKSFYRILPVLAALLVMTLACDGGDSSDAQTASPLPSPESTQTTDANAAAPVPAPVPDQTLEGSGEGSEISPTATVSPNVAPAETPTPVSTSTPAPTPAPTSTPIVLPTPIPVDVTVISSEASITFPDAINFQLTAYHMVPLVKVELEFGTENVYSCATREYSSVRMDIEPGGQLQMSWDWEMKKTGSIPPGTTVWWRWRFEDVYGNQYLRPRQEIEYEDTRFDWRSYTRDNITLYWNTGSADFGRELADGTADGLATLQLGRELTRPIKAYIYASAADVRGAALYVSEWAGGLAFPSENILLIAVSPDASPEEMTGLTHELAHLLVEEVSFGCFGPLPRWLDEGLATYAEGEINSYQQLILDQAVATDDLITLRSLSSSFPASQERATLSYAQSGSVVSYLIESHGWSGMRALLAAYESGSTDDAALQTAYGIDVSTLDREWNAWIAARYATGL